ncbi:MAG TPA: serine--tRNA ligase [Tepidisphaeraceae bacterium]|jgi:seryl-tRNA synthetase|nr:serine--tRNA ligase [Tepidisphaeraceae bacterium]
MVDLKDLRENPDKYRRGAELKNVPVDFDSLLKADEQQRSAQREFEKFRTEQNEASKKIGATKDPEQKKAAIAAVGEVTTRAKEAEKRAKSLATEVEQLLLKVPQPPDEDVPVGKDASQNVVLYHWGEPRKFDFKPKSHIELCEKLDLVDFPAGVRLAGSRSYFLKGGGAELHAAVLRLAFDLMVNEKGFTPMSVPVLVREPAMLGTGFFPAGREQAYRVGEIEETGDDVRYLTGTGEVGLTAYHIDEVLEESTLPRKYTTISTCFRREAGTYGKDTAGLYRVHQFDKCEQVVICKNDVEESKRWHKEMLSYSEELLKRLNLPYRVIQCCTGDIGVKNASMMDVETWMPSRSNGKDPESGYGETHSASRLYEFQARRLNLRYKGTDGKTRFVHTLNNTVVASPRILIPILENYQNADGTVTVPEVLRKYMYGRELIGS